MKLFAAAVLASAANASPATPVPTGNCMEDNWFLDGNKGDLVCRAKEVHLENVAATERRNCVEGEMINLDLTASVVFNTERYDVGWYIALDGGDALTGECHTNPLLEDDYPDGLAVLDSPGSDVVVGQVQWNADQKGGNDKCGDVKLNAGGSGVLDFMNLGKDLRLQCQDKDQDGNMDFAICFSWRQPGGDDFCNPERLYPGTPSKCFCTRYEIPQISVKVPDSPVADC